MQNQHLHTVSIFCAAVCTQIIYKTPYYFKTADMGLENKLRKTFGKFFRSYSELLSNFGDISIRFVPKGISHLVFYGHLFSN